MYGPMNRGQAAVLLLAVALAAAPLASGTVPAAATPATAASEPPLTQTIEADSTEFRITVYANASARWTFTYTRVLENDTEREQFESFAAEFERNETDAYREFQTTATGLTARARNVTGRAMRARDFSRSAGLGGDCVAQECGTIRMGFTWTAFAAEDGDRLVIGDVFGTGLYVSPDMNLVVEAGPGLAFASASPETYNDPDLDISERRSITYRGEQSFADRRPRVVFVPDVEGAGTATRTPTRTRTVAPDASPSSPSPTDAAGGGFPMGLVGAVVLLVGAGAGYAWWRRGGGVAAPEQPGPGDGGGGAAAEQSVTGAPAVPEEELLTDEDRVVSLLEENGGRMKQVAIVEETGWSKSKVSMLLSDMEDEGAISKLRVGRENIISLAGHEPEAAGSPHEED